MHNGNDRAALLLYPQLRLPTHVIVVNLDARLHDSLEEMAAFLPSFGISLLHFHEGHGATVSVDEINEAQLLRMLPDLASFDLEDPQPWARATYRYHRPAMLHAIRAACKSWADSLRQDRTVFVFVGSPRTRLESALIGELPLDAIALFFRRTGMLPLVLRLLVAPREPTADVAGLALANALADLEQTYFELSEFPRQSDRDAIVPALSSSPYDTTVWIDSTEGDEIIPFLRGLLRLHGHENERCAANRPPEKRSDDAVASIEDALRFDGEHRLVDWLSMCSVDHAPRMWIDSLATLGNTLDMEHDARRRREPFASIERYRREDGWKESPLIQSHVHVLEQPRAVPDDLTRSDFPYRITDEDRASKLELAHQLADFGEFERAADIASELLAEDPHHRLLNRMLGTDLYVSGHRARGSEILRHCIVLTESDPLLEEAERADEIATLHHLLSDFDAAISGYERAIDADPLNAHAYQGLIIILRARGDEALADHWLQAARRRDLDLPLLAETEGQMADAFVATPADADHVSESESDSGRMQERRSRWWRFLRR